MTKPNVRKVPMTRDTKLILCPVNLRHTQTNYDAYEEAIAMARRRGAKLLVATVAPEMERNLNIRDSESFWGEQLQKFVAAHPAEGVELETVIRKGAVHRQIVKLAEERNVDVIVMESANPKVQDYLLGTTASHVVTHAKCSVFVVRG
ncbi:MAG: universal stress protein [Silicimonas sp.]|nr:universal stress protein [Silicimonas sp.]